MKNQQDLAILFADISDSTALYEKEGDVVAHEIVSKCLILMEQKVTQAEGKLLRMVGDEVLASFSSVDNALRAAVNIQQAYQDTSLSIRVGFHFGLVIPDRGDVYGNVVNIAARIAAVAAPNEIVTSEEALAQLSLLNHAKIESLRAIAVKGIEHPINIYRVLWRKDDVGHTTLRRSIVDHLTVAASSVLQLTYNGREFNIRSSDERFTIGRDLDNDLQPTENSVSRMHAYIEFKRDKYLLTDRSTNGTWIVRQGEEPTNLHRESAQISGSGVIGAGFVPSEKDDEGILYRFISS